jgi:bidirectional [NiFe] hydrogenase diaphorase subunit
MSEVSLTINDIEVKAEEGMTILQAARSIGIDIPTLCSHEKLAPYGACRLCTVEIKRGNKSQLVASCVQPVEDGLIVDTESEPVAKGRRMLLALLWAHAPGVQALRKYGIKYGIDEAGAGTDYMIMPGISAPKTKFYIEPTFCVLCGICVRYCAEVKNNAAIGFIGRGTEREVVFFPEIASQACPSCGEECYPLCPTGALPLHYTIAKAYHSTEDLPTKG